MFNDSGSVEKKVEQLVSVIVPVYNVEEYLDECVESIVLQTYKTLEIILVDDGSTDRSGKKCDEWREKDERITVIHQKNMGLSAARNSGIDKCLGEWITFIDSDDAVSLDYVAYLYGLVQKYEVIVAQCDRGDLQENKERNDIFEKKINSCEFLLSSYYQTTAWGKIYKKELFEKERYPVGMVHEDMAVTYKLVYCARNVGVTNKILYYVRQRTGSITRKEKFYKERLVVLQFLREQIEFFEEKKENELVKKGYRNYAYALLENYNKTKKAIKDKETELKIKKEYQRICYRVIKEDDIISLKTRILLAFCFMIPELWEIVMKE